MDIQFQEIQYLPELTFAVVIGLIFHILLLYRRLPLPLNITICVLLLPILLLYFELRTVVDHQTIQIQFGRIPFIRHTIPQQEIVNEKVITYIPMDDSWGVWTDEKATPPFMPRGEQGLLLELNDGSRYLIASQRIKELQQAIQEKRKRSGILPTSAIQLFTDFSQGFSIPDIGRTLRSAVLDFISSINIGRGTLRFGIENLLNNQYLPVVSQIQTTNSANAAGRGINLSVGYSVEY